ncbi:MAG: adenylate/guanylate cyclase domain-containing protein [Acidimicrobiales bacterium]
MGPCWNGHVDPVTETHYAKADDGVHIAYQVFGEGSFDLVVIPGFISHVELSWEDEILARALHRLGSFSRVIMFDKRGTGMSDRTERLPDIDRRMLDIEAVMHAADSGQAAFLTMSEGGPMAILFAAAHPERTRALVLVNTYARITACHDYPIGMPTAQLYEGVQYLEPGWGTGVGLGAWAPSVADDAGARSSFARLQRMAASPGAAMALMSSYMDIDVRPALPLVHVPTLVIHRTGDRMVPVAHGHYLAEHVDGARLVELPGTDHFWWTENADEIVDEVEEFLTGVRSVPAADRVLASVLFTDIVDSTRRAVELGDREWRLLLNRHDALAERQVKRHGGRLVKMTGDGVLATFDGPARSVRCARAISDGARALGVEVRAGVHTGEVELRGDDIAGLGVNIASRIEALAQPGEVLVSRTVTDLVAGSGLDFDDRGEHELKGVPGRWRLFAARP